VPRFHYRALRPSGAEIAGELVAEDERDAISRLQAIGNFPIEISLPSERTRPRWRLGTRSSRLPARDLVLFTRQLATLTSAGVPLDRALGLIGAGPVRQRRTRLGAELLEAVNRGESLSRACREHTALPSHYAMVIAAGEVRGDIGDALERLATVLERSRATSRALLGALIYPASVLVVACVSVSFLLAFVVPRFEELLASLQHEPPIAMRILLFASAVFEQAALPVLVIALAIVGFVVFRWRDAHFRLALDRRLLGLPMAGAFLRKVEAERLAFLLGNLIGAGVTLPAAIAATAAAATHQSSRAGLLAAEQAVERGDSLTVALSAGGLLPDMAAELVRIGEETGDLATMLLKASDILQREIDASSAEMIGLITPVSTILLGLLIGAIAFALLGTILQVYDVTG
jgi:general secretion pathway protein F